VRREIDEMLANMPTKEKEKLQKAVISVIKWAIKRSCIYPGRAHAGINSIMLLETALKLAKIGIDVETKRRAIILSRSLSVLDWSKARSKSAGVSNCALLQAALDVARMAKEDIRKELKETT